MLIVADEHQKDMLKRIRQRKWVIPAIACIIIVLAGAHIFYQYRQQPFFLKDTDSLVDRSIVKTIDRDYDDSRCLTREEVVLVISDVFFHLKQKGFEKTEDKDGTIDQAIKIKLLEGDGKKYYLEEQATKQEALVFIGKGLRVFEDTNVESEPGVLDEIVCEEWAKEQIEELIARNYFSIDDIIGLDDLYQAVTISDLKILLDKVVEVKTQKIDFFPFVNLWVEGNPVFSVIIGVSAIASILGLIIQMFDLWKQGKVVSLARGTICLAGSGYVGKSTLKNKMKRPAKPIYSEKKDEGPTRTSISDEIELRTRSGDVAFKGTIIDVPGGSPENVFQFLRSKEYENKILLLVFAHTKGDSEEALDPDFIHEQLVDIEKIWVTAIYTFGKELNKVVVFINKNDLLDEEYNPAEINIYGKHFELLCDACEAEGVEICVVEGSSRAKRGLDELYEQLRPNPPI